MPARVPPGLEVIADDHAIEADLLGVSAEIQKLDRAELLGRRLVAKSQRRHTAFDSRRRCLLGSSGEVYSPVRLVVGRESGAQAKCFPLRVECHREEEPMGSARRLASRRAGDEGSMSRIRRMSYAGSGWHSRKNTWEATRCGVGC